MMSHLWKGDSSRKLLAVGTAITLVFVIVSPFMRSRLLLNVAQLARIRGEKTPELLKASLAANQQDPHLRWQVGEGLADAGDYRAAVEVLLPLETSTTFQPLGVKTLIESLVRIGEASYAYKLFVERQEALPLDAWAASRLWLNIAAGHTPVEWTSFSRLIEQALSHNLSIGELQLLSQLLADDEFGQRQAGQHLLEVLRYRSASCCRDIKSSISAKVSVDDISAMMNIPTSSLDLGPELAANGEFTAVNAGDSMPAGWSPSYMTTGNPWNRALFVLGIDDGAARVDGIIVEQRADLEPARAGFWHPVIPVKQRTPYLISFVYRTQNVSSSKLGATFYLSDDDAVITGVDHPLPPTDNKWTQVIIVGWNRREQDTYIQPLLRSFSEGTVWFDNFSVKEILVQVPLMPREPIVMYRVVGQPISINTTLSNLSKWF